MCCNAMQYNALQCNVMYCIARYVYLHLHMHTQHNITYQNKESHRLASHRNASSRIESHRTASHCIAWHRSASHTHTDEVLHLHAARLSLFPMPKPELLDRRPEECSHFQPAGQLIAIRTHGCRHGKPPLRVQEVRGSWGGDQQTEGFLLAAGVLAHVFKTNSSSLAILGLRERF